MFPPVRSRWGTLGRLLLVSLVVGSCDAYDLFDRPNAPLAGSTTSACARLAYGRPAAGMEDQREQRRLRHRGLTVEGRRAFVHHGASDASVEWSWGAGGIAGSSVSGLLHTDPAGPIATGIRVAWWSGVHLIEGSETLATSAPMPAATVGDTARLEVVGTEARFIHNGLLAIDWVAWSGQTTGEHGLFATDDGAGAALAKVVYVTFDTLAAGPRPYHLPVGFDVTGATDQTTALDDFMESVPMARPCSCRATRPSGRSGSCSTTGPVWSSRETARPSGRSRCRRTRMGTVWSTSPSSASSPGAT